MGGRSRRGCLHGTWWSSVTSPKEWPCMTQGPRPDRAREGKTMAKNDCPHNSGVTCPESGRHCTTCGWSPEGARRRQGFRPAKSPPPDVQPTKHKGGKARQVAKINEAGDVLEIYPSLVMAAAVNCMNPSSIKYHCQGTLKHPFRCTGGYTFHYADEMQEDGA